MDTILPACSYCGKEIPPVEAPRTAFLEKTGIGEIPLPFCSDPCLSQWMQKRPGAVPPAPAEQPAPISALEENIQVAQEAAPSAAGPAGQHSFPGYHLPVASSYIAAPPYVVVPEQPQPAAPPDLVAHNLKSLDRLSGEVQYVEHHAVRQRLKYRIRPKTLFERIKDRLKAVWIIPYDRDAE